MPTRQQTVRIPDELEAAVRAQHSELRNESLSLIIRVALAGLAGWAIRDALPVLRGTTDPRGLRIPDSLTSKPPDRRNRREE